MKRSGLELLDGGGVFAVVIAIRAGGFIRREAPPGQPLRLNEAQSDLFGGRRNGLATLVTHSA